jgi:hypothetical protein
MGIAGYSLTVCGLTHNFAILMPNTPNELAIVDSEWLQPDTIEKMLRTVPSILSSLSKLKTLLPKRPKRNPRDLAAEIDELTKALAMLIEILKTASESHSKLSIRFVETVGGLVNGPIMKLVSFIKGQAENNKKVTTIVLGHEARIKTLEASIAAGKGKRASGKKSLAH